MSDNMKEIDVIGLMKALKTKGEAKLSDHEIKDPENTELMKKYFVKEELDPELDLYVSEFKIPSGKDFDKCIKDILNYFKNVCVNPDEAKQEALNELKKRNLSAKTGARIKISMNTFECEPLEIIKSR